MSHTPAPKRRHNWPLRIASMTVAHQYRHERINGTDAIATLQDLGHSRDDAMRILAKPTRRQVRLMGQRTA